ncbi:hypothetical protein HHL19_35810 [Streptomyces sp. R302]|uniref:hypothetical protein n=1 Tax=unclassified Streptomyces TaxID=2593676 RepID=UPI00145DB00D|nr:MULTISPECIES: hypothetical protein [unclassified Streptomyces]NML55093.1 hypothetical protein [Streptomyces sp. R301]NML83877.1 hypothetical protein [Streptomyces sp. R302]
MATATTPTTDIRSADELITLADAFNLSVTVKSTTNEDVTTHTVRITVPVPAPLAGTERGRELLASAAVMQWAKSTGKGARARRVSATAETSTGQTQLLTLAAIDLAIRDMGQAAAEYARETAPRTADVHNAPHALYFGDNRRGSGFSADHIRKIVSNRRFAGRFTHLDDDGTVHCGTHRYVPQPGPARTKTPAPQDRQHLRIVNGGTPQLIPTPEALAEINHAMMGGKSDVRRMSASRDEAFISYKDPARGTVILRPVHEGDYPSVLPERPTDDELAGQITDGYRAFLARTFSAVADNTAIPVCADMLRPGMDVVSAVRQEQRTVSTVTRYTGPGTPSVTAYWVCRVPTDSVSGDARTFPPDFHLIVTRESLHRLYGTLPSRPAAEVLAADPIPASASVLDGMPGRELTREELRRSYVALPYTSYLVQLRDAGRWILPNHDDGAHMMRGHVALALRRTLDDAPGTARATVDTDGTVYVSNGRQAARYIPAPLITAYDSDHCPGCSTPYATNGDGPCTGGRSLSAEERRRAAEKDQMRAVAYAGRWWAEQGTDTPTDDAMREAFKRSGSQPRPELYPTIRAAIAANMPPVAAAPLFAAHAAHKAVMQAASLTPRDVQNLAHHVEELRRAAPARLHTQLHAAAVAADDAWPLLKTASTPTEQDEANDRARHALVACRAAILAVAPRAHRMHGTDLPATDAAIRVAARAYNAADSTPEELLGTEYGPVAVRVQCRADIGSGGKITAVITAGVDNALGGFIPAHPPLVVKFTRQDDRLDPAENARKAIGPMFRVDVPVDYVVDRS